MNSLFKGFVIVLCLAFASCSPAPQCPDPSREEPQTAKQALADFAVNLFKNISSKDESKNQAISPLSVALGLVLLKAGGEGQVCDDIKLALLESSTRQDFFAVFVNLERQLQIKKDKTELNIVNGVFQDKDLKLKDDFTSLMKNCFKAEVDRVDFKNELEQARQKVNRFVSQKTQQKIPELYKQGDLKKDDRIVFASALYFKASWGQSFDKKQTKQDTFYRNGRDEQKVQFMQSTVSLRHAESGDVSALEIPYDDQELSMVLVLPKSRDGLRNVEQKLTGQQLRDILSRLQQKQVQVQVPKFQIRSHVDLKPILSRMGLESVFSRTADYNRISDTKITFDSSIHEAYISVDENGTEGAAATGFAGKAMASIDTPEPSVQFKADHPFLYAVVHKQTGAIVFLGKVNSIEKQE